MLDDIQSSTAGALTKSETSQQKLAKDLDQFLNLLVTQLKHQDPLDPMDPNEFTSQLVQFASVEQQIQSNANLERMLELQQTSLLGTVVDYIGKQVEVEGNKMPLENGHARADYQLLSKAEKTTVSVTNSKGQVVFFTGGETSPGKHSFEWDGQNNFGFPVPDGVYTIKVAALDSDGDPVKVSQTVTGTVTGVSIDKGIATLSVGETDYNVDDVISVRQPPAATAPFTILSPASLPEERTETEATEAAKTEAAENEAEETKAEETE